MDFQLTEEQKLLQQSARELAERHFAAKAFTWDEKGEYPWENLKLIADHGFAGITIPAEDGGQGGTVLDAVLVLEQIAYVCPASGDAVQATNFGAIRQLAMFGTPEQKEEYLKPCLRGEKLVTIGMSEPDAGSAVTDLRTTARYEGDYVILNGSKVFNSNGPHAHFYVVWCRFDKDDPRSAGAVIVAKGMPGFTTGSPQRFMSGELHCQLFFDNARIPRKNVLVDYDGFRKMLNVFNVERLGNATRSLALAQRAFDMAVEHLKERKQFGRRLCEFQGLQWKIAEMKVKLDAARLLLYRAAANAAQGLPSAQDVTIAKYYCNQVGFEVAHEALQCFGGYGYSTDYPLEYIFRRVRGWMIAGGTLEMLRNRIAEGVFGERFSQRPPKAAR